MIRLWLFLAALALPGTGIAKTITVQSGEHPGFSRLVVYYKGVTDWSFASVDGGYELRPEKSGMTYNLDSVYQLIPRDRIAKIVAQPNGLLFLSVNCACHAEVFEHLGQVVVDVKDGAETPTTDSPEAAISTVYPAAAPSPAKANAMPEAEAFRGLPPPYRPYGTELSWNGQDYSAPLSQGPPFAGHGQAPEANGPDKLIAETRSTLVAQIARAASNGLVTPDIAIPQSAPTSTKVVLTESIEPVAPMADETVGLSGPNVRIETAFERSELATDTPTPRNKTGENCLPPSQFDLSAWGQSTDQGTAIANYRAGLVGEFDAANPESLAALARHYIYLTFGAEAQSLIRSFDGQIKGAAVLNMLAEIMDTGQSNAFPAIASQISCDSASALWAILAKPTLKPSDKVSAQAVLSAFSALPLHLRRHLGPGLADRFLQVSDAGTAATIRNSITRAPGATSAGVKMMEAGIALELGNHQLGMDQLSEVIEDNGSLTPAAVIALIDASLKAGKTPDADLVDTANALAFEARGSIEGAQLTLASLRAQAHMGKVVEVLDELNRATVPFDLPAQQVDRLRRDVIDLASQNGTDAQFLQVVFRGPPGLGTDPSSILARRRVAERLISLDFFKKARAVLNEDPGVPAPEDRVLYAKSHIGEGRPDLAIGYLAGLGDEAATQLRAQAHALAKEYARAGALYSDLGQSEESARAAWRGQNLEAVRQIGSEAEVAAAVLGLVVAPQIPDAITGVVTLAESARVLKQSREARQVLATLLAEISQP